MTKNQRLKATRKLFEFAKSYWSSSVGRERISLITGGWRFFTGDPSFTITVEFNGNRVLTSHGWRCVLDAFIAVAEERYGTSELAPPEVRRRIILLREVLGMVGAGYPILTSHLDLRPWLTSGLDSGQPFPSAGFQEQYFLYANRGGSSVP